MSVKSGLAHYVLAGLQFVGFLLGGFSIYATLKSKLVCTDCNQYLRPIGKISKVFATTDEGSNYYENLLTHSLQSGEFAAMVSNTNKIDKLQVGAVTINASLLGCLECKKQTIEENFQVFNRSKEWKAVDSMKRQIALPKEVNLTSYFRK